MLPEWQHASHRGQAALVVEDAVETIEVAARLEGLAIAGVAREELDVAVEDLEIQIPGLFEIFRTQQPVVVAHAR